MVSSDQFIPKVQTMKLKYKQMHLVNSGRMFLLVGGILLEFYRTKSVGRVTLLASYFHVVLDSLTGLFGKPRMGICLRFSGNVGSCCVYLMSDLNCSCHRFTM